MLIVGSLYQRAIGEPATSTPGVADIGMSPGDHERVTARTHHCLVTEPMSAMLDSPSPVAGDVEAPVPAAHQTPALRVEWARSPAQVREALRLRYLVFATEMGAHLTPPPGTPPGHDADRFDPWCEHLLVRAIGPGFAPSVIGTYRVLTPEGARRAGGLYTDQEFDLGRLSTIRHGLAEFGRSCVHPAWRQGAVMLTLWSALAEFMVRQGVSSVIGCASVSVKDGGHGAASLWHRLSQRHLAVERLRVEPRRALPVAELRSDLLVDTPPLLKGYLRCGAQLLGPPAWDPDFNVADFPVLLRLSDLTPRHRRHLLGVR
jgi:putative hemolysin